MKKGLRPEVIKRYSDSFKQEVVMQIEEGLSAHGACRRYGVSIASIDRWIKRYGKQEALCKKIMVMKPDEQTENQKLKARIKELEKAVVSVQLDKLIADSYLEIACEQLKTDAASFKKKTDQKR